MGSVVETLEEGSIPTEGTTAVVEHEPGTDRLPTPADGPLSVGERGVLEAAGWAVPTSLTDYRATGGFVAPETGGPERAISEIREADLRDRGRGDAAADVPVADRWETARAASGEAAIVINANEADRLGSGAMTNSLEDLAEADTFLVVGSNPAAQQPVAFNSYVRPAVNGGATLIHVDPRANRTTRAADIHLAPRPGSDALVATLLAAIAREEELIDREFLAERTAGFEEYERALAGLDVPVFADRAAIDRGQLRAAARAFGSVERGAVLLGTGVEADDHCGTEAADALLDLCLLTGNLGKPGTGMNPLRGLVNEQGANDVGARPHTLPGYRPVSDADVRARLEREWGIEIPASPGYSEPEAVREFGSGVRGAYVLAENPAVTKTDTQGVARGVRNLDFLLVQELFPAETTACADVVLPASAAAEKEGTVTNLDRQVQRLWPLRAPPGEARRDFDVLRTIGARLTDLPFAYAEPSEVFREMTRVNSLYAGMDYAAIDRGSQRWPFEGATEGTAVLHRDRFANGQRRVRFAPESIPATPAAGGSDGTTAATDDELVLLTRNQVNEARPTRAEDEERSLQIHPADALEAGVVDGESIVVENDHGALRPTARITDRVRERTVFLGANAAAPLVAGERTRVRVRADS
ncbi:formate dehydrogenase subunit alpha [Halobacteriales archaeon QH_8_64_26]|nr:MAG: formate dehydrogenase subunit alpha [Halobacteriales archaeon QH_8_64_26]